MFRRLTAWLDRFERPRGMLTTSEQVQIDRLRRTRAQWLDAVGQLAIAQRPARRGPSGFVSSGVTSSPSPPPSPPVCLPQAFGAQNADPAWRIAIRIPNGGSHERSQRHHLDRCHLEPGYWLFACF